MKDHGKEDGKTSETSEGVSPETGETDRGTGLRDRMDQKRTEGGRVGGSVPSVLCGRVPEQDDRNPPT